MSHYANPVAEEKHLRHPGERVMRYPLEWRPASSSAPIPAPSPLRVTASLPTSPPSASSYAVPPPTLEPAGPCPPAPRRSQRKASSVPPGGEGVVTSASLEQAEEDQNTRPGLLAIVGERSGVIHLVAAWHQTGRPVSLGSSVLVYRRILC